MIKLLIALLFSLTGISVAVVHYAPSSAFGGFAGEHGGRASEHFMAPEIDPASAISALTLLVGGVAVVRGRMAKQ